MLVGPEQSLGDQQSRMNDSTRGQWDWYASHRAQIERLIVPARPGGAIAVLGAGNCNDLDLKWLVQAYGHVHLFDIDRSALERAAQRQGVADHPHLTLTAPYDLTGVADLTRSWTGRRVPAAEVAAAATAASADVPPPGQFDVVLSPCVLSQLLVGVRDLLGKDHPDWPALRAAIRARHLRAIARAVVPDGRGVLIVDLASTSGLPGLDRARPEHLPDLMRLCVRDAKCFKSLEPAQLQQTLRTHAGVTQTSISLPWLWHLGFSKAFLCYGLTITPPKKPTP